MSDIARDFPGDRYATTGGGAALMNDLDVLARGLKALEERVESVVDPWQALAIEERYGTIYSDVLRIIFEDLEITPNGQGVVTVSPKPPFWRLSGYVWHPFADTTVLDSAYFDGPDVPTAKKVRDWSMYTHGPGGSLLWEGHTTAWCVWARMGIENRGTANQTVNWWVPTVNDAIVVLIEDPTEVLPGTVSITGTAVTGTGTNFLTHFGVDDYIIMDAPHYQVLRVSAITNDTSMTLANAGVDVSAGTPFRRGRKQLIDNNPGGASVDESSGSFAVNTGVKWIVHVMWLNIDLLGVSPDNQFMFLFLTDAFDQPGLLFFDPGTRIGSAGALAGETPNP